MMGDQSLEPVNFWPNFSVIRLQRSPDPKNWNKKVSDLENELNWTRNYRGSPLPMMGKLEDYAILLFFCNCIPVFVTNSKFFKVFWISFSGFCTFWFSLSKAEYIRFLPSGYPAQIMFAFTLFFSQLLEEHWSLGMMLTSTSSRNLLLPVSMVSPHPITVHVSPPETGADGRHTGWMAVLNERDELNFMIARSFSIVFFLYCGCVIKVLIVRFFSLSSFFLWFQSPKKSFTLFTFTSLGKQWAAVITVVLSYTAPPQMWPVLLLMFTMNGYNMLPVLVPFTILSSTGTLLTPKSQNCDKRCYFDYCPFRYWQLSVNSLKMTAFLVQKTTLLISSLQLG